MPKSPKPPRRKAKQARSQQTIDAILEAAAHVLVREGYPRATTNRIAARAGTSIGTLYQYFADKDALFDALMRREFAGATKRFEQIELSTSRTLEEILREIIEVGATFQPFGSKLYQALEHVPGARFQKRAERAVDSVTELFNRLLSLHRDRLRSDDIEATAYMAVACSIGVARTAKSEVYDTYLTDELVDLLIRYLIADSD